MIELISSPWLWPLVYGIPLVTSLLGVGAFATYFERRFAGRMQNRLGPAWVGPAGAFQVIADGLKMMQKEDIVPRNADKFLFNLAPLLPVFLVISTAAVIPFAGWWNEDGTWHNALLVADLEIGILWVLGLAGLMLFPIWMAGWSSNNKYTLLGGMRAVAQGISYEIPLIMAAIVPVVATGSLSLSDMVTWQAEHGWLIWRLPGVGFLAFCMFFVASLAEANRIPFDVPEAESELLAGVIVEYTGLKNGIFLLSEYIHTFLASVLASVLFLGGAHMPFVSHIWWLGPIWLLAKALTLFVLIYWIRWSLFRFRADQLMTLCWTILVPVSLALVMLTALQIWAEGLLQ
ncbi:MAG: NADH-quinone oxidoreductase subunit H [Kiritimatiellia bacterium]|jgi:NADH-quinone oxidoreductase subunit H